MGAAKHTPGPWHWVDSATDGPFRWDGTNEGYPSLRTVAFFGEDKTEVRDGLHYTSFALPKFVLDCDELNNPDDARLIAAAPELLEALRELVSLEADGKQASESAIEYWERARTVIARATGEQP